MDMKDSMTGVLRSLKDDGTKRVFILLVDLLESLNQRIHILEGQAERRIDTARGPVQPKKDGGAGGLSIG
jgi:hypothetical protein